MPIAGQKHREGRLFYGHLSGCRSRGWSTFPITDSMIPFFLYLRGCIFVAGLADIRIYRNILYVILQTLAFRIDFNKETIRLSTGALFHIAHAEHTGPAVFFPFVCVNFHHAVQVSLGAHVDIHPPYIIFRTGLPVVQDVAGGGVWIRIIIPAVRIRRAAMEHGAKPVSPLMLSATRACHFYKHRKVLRIKCALQNRRAILINILIYRAGQDR